MKKLIVLGSLFVTTLLKSQIVSQDVKFVNIHNNDIIYVPSEDKIYVTTPSSGNNGNSLCVIDPYTGTVEQCFFIGSEPNKLALSNNDEYLYIGLNGTPNVVQFDLNTKQIVRTFTIGSDPSFGPFYVENMLVLPNEPNSVVITRRNIGLSPKHEGVAIYDSGVMRPNTRQDHTGSNTIAFDKLGGGLYGYTNESTNFGFRTLAININGVTESAVNSGLIEGFGYVIESQDNFIYSSGGEVVKITNGIPTRVGRFTFPSNAFKSAVEPAPDTNLVYFVTNDFGNEFKLETFNKSSFNYIGTKTFSNILGDLQGLINWGDDGKLAFNTDQSIVILRSCISIITTPLVLSPSTVGGCFGESVVVTAPANLPNYFWSTGETTQSISVNQEGSFSFSVADSNGCLSPPSNLVDVIFDFQPSSPYINSNPYLEICQGEVITLTTFDFSSNESLIWSTGATTSSIEVSSGGIYSVSVVSEFGCVGYSSYPIEVIELNDTVPNQPTITVDGLTEFCLGETTTTLSATEGFDVYEWSNGQNTQSIEVFNSGLYTVRVANFSSCFSNPSQGVLIDVNPSPSSPFIQANGNVLASSSQQGNQWFLNGSLIPGATGQFFTATEDGFYTVQVSLNGCNSPMSNIYSFNISSINQLSLEIGLVIFPNPATDIINVQYLDNPDKTISKIEIFNLLGQRLSQTYQSNRISINNFPSGLFFIKIYDSDNRIIKTDSFVKS